MSSLVAQEAGRDPEGNVDGEFIDFAGDRFFVIRNVEQMAPFFISVISADDHWLFVSSNGGLTAGRVSPDTALFPYVTVDKLHNCGNSTGPKTIVRIRDGGSTKFWEPFNREHQDRYQCSNNLYKNTLGNKLCFEEINHDLGLAFRYTWSTSSDFGFVRDCELENLGETALQVDVLDGLQNILPAGTPRFTQTNSSNLVDAYKWTELDAEAGLAILTLYSGITDRAEPSESLRATTAYCLGIDNPTCLISAKQIEAFRNGREVVAEDHRRGIRGAYLVSQSVQLAGTAACSWRIVLDAEQRQEDVVVLRRRLGDPTQLDEEISASVQAGSEELARIMASADGFQATAEERVSVHHYANVLFNVLRGGIFEDRYNVSARDFSRTVRHFNKPVFDRNRKLLDALPPRLRFDELFGTVRKSDDPQLRRLTLEYLPITFGRRHGDPSRPWNQFAIQLKDENGEGLLSYQGNWRDIFQNWEALAFSYPEFIENMIAKFVNASTVDGYNPYRITKEGIDWEVEEPDNPWSYIGYWGDHQIIYLLKLLELSRSFHPDTLHKLLHDPVFCYANVPYRIKPLAQLLEDPKNTVVFDEDVAAAIDERVEQLGADGKLVLDAQGSVLQVNLLEKLFVPLLSKLGNLVVDGGIWLNTQRPEWNDANNALVGQGLSMVTLYYMRRYISFMQDLLRNDTGDVTMSTEVGHWLTGTADALARLRTDIEDNSVDNAQRLASLKELGTVASYYRQGLYQAGTFSGSEDLPVATLQRLLDDAQVVVDRSITTNKRHDGLYHAYNIAEFDGDDLPLEHLYPMLEGQVAALSSGAIAADEAVGVLEALFASSVYREDQDSFMLYPDRELPRFLQRNQVAEVDAQSIPLLATLLDNDDRRIVVRDAEGDVRFNSDFTNAGDLTTALAELSTDYGYAVDESSEAIGDLYESVFDHKAFTGRSGTMFGFEGLGSIYWHMVAKLLLAVEENFFDALDNDADAATLQRLGDLYYRVRSGIGFNKTPKEYGAFPTDPYSHTPKHAGARQPGMTGQVKEEVLTRFAELGVRVNEGAATFQPALLRRREFSDQPRSFRYLDVDNAWQDFEVPTSSLAFTWCQVPVVYVLAHDAVGVDINFDDGTRTRFDELALPADISAGLFERSGHVRKITVSLAPQLLFGD